MILLYIMMAIILILVLFVLHRINTLNVGRKKAEEEIEKMQYTRLSPFGSVKELTVLPLIDYYAGRNDLHTEPGVSYFIKADELHILMDVGRNLPATHPSPLLENMKALGVRVEDLDFIFLSHLHLDHLGGMEEQRKGTFSLSRGPVDLGSVMVYTPAEVSPSSWNPEAQIKVIKEPAVLKPGIASIGVHPRFLFLMGYTLEHSLAVNVEGKGIVLIVGCGHQKLARIIERARELFDEPLYGIIGGLHYPVRGGRIKKGPLDLQHITASDNPPWKGLTEEDVYADLEILKQANPRLVALSPHDSSDWAIAQFRQVFGDKYVDIRVGEEICIG